MAFLTIVLTVTSTPLPLISNIGSINRFKGDAINGGYGFAGSLVIIASPLMATDR